MEYHLHIGAHRTGTTSTQKLLETSAAKLRAGGVVVWGPEALRGWGLYDLLQKMADAGAPSDRIADARARLRGWAEGSGSATRIVVTDENLSGNMLQNHAEATLYPEATARFRALGQLLPGPPDVVCVTIRDLVGYWQSAFAHLSSRGKLASFDADRLTRSPGKSWLPFLHAVRTAFPKARLVILRYDQAVVGRLLAELVGPVLATSLPPAKRDFGLALPDEALARLPSGPERKAMVLRLRETRDTEDRAFSAEQAKELDAAYAADWQALRAGAIAGAILDPVALAKERTP